MSIQKIRVDVEFASGEMKSGYVEMDLPIVSIPGFRQPIPKAQRAELKKRLVKNFGKIQSYRIRNYGGN
jgi:hypothetical protein